MRHVETVNTAAREAFNNKAERRPWSCGVREVVLDARLGKDELFCRFVNVVATLGDRQ